MTMQADLLAAMNKGVEADDTANANRVAVQTILAQVEQGLATFAGAPVELVRQPRSGPSEALMPPGVRHILEPPARRYQVLAVKHGDATHDLCEWEEGALVFPVTLRFSKRTEVAFDEMSLVAALNDLLATPAVGRILKHLRGPAARAAQ